ncbi:MAG TPA: hypothetical protein VHW26_03150 [Solirubrobacteraceae bacterium]|nr:hypothetical protein [Solirubrobacteraceae bacterium]
MPKPAPNSESTPVVGSAPGMSICLKAPGASRTKPCWAPDESAKVPERTPGAVTAVRKVDAAPGTSIVVRAPDGARTKPWLTPAASVNEPAAVPSARIVVR